MRIAVLGAGALGCLFAGLLAEHGLKVTLIGRDAVKMMKIRSQGILIHSCGKVRRIRVDVATNTSTISCPDLVLVAVKSYDTDVAVKQIKPTLASGSRVLTVQNGLGNMEKIGAIVGYERVYGGVTVQASTLLAAGEVFHAGEGPTVIGRLDGAVSRDIKDVAGAFNKCGLKTRVTSNIRGAVWSKVLVNAGINPLSAITGLSNGDLLKRPELKAIMVKAVVEGAAVSKAAGISLDVEDPVKLTLETAERTAKNRSSMLQDVTRGSKTEIDFINGAIVRISGVYDVPTPLNTALVAQVKLLEEKALPTVQKLVELVQHREL